MQILSVGTALPPHYYDQQELLAAFRRAWGGQLHNPARLEQLHRNVLVGGRHLALPIEEYENLASFTDSNDAFIRCAVDLGARAMEDGLRLAGLTPGAIDHLFFVSVTGIATPSVDARLVNRLKLRPDVKRTPIFGLGCVAGAAGVARTADYLRAFPDQVAVLLSVELCSLTLQRRDVSIPNLIASGLFGDGAAAVVMAGLERAGAAPLGGPEQASVGAAGGARIGGRAAGGPRVIATRSVFYPDTEYVMGWEIGSEGFRVVLSADVPDVVARHIRSDVDGFLADHELSLEEIESFICHPGGPRVIEALERALGLPSEAFHLAWKTLRELGNLSSASVLMVLRDTMASRPSAGSYGLMLAMGPGFCSELILLRW